MDTSRRFYGLYRGTVFDVRDPGKHSRIRVQVPQILGDAPTEWAWPLEVSQTKVALPNVGQGVWVMFEGGDPHFPIWIGTFGKYKGTGIPAYIKPSSYSLATLPSHLVPGTASDGTSGVDLMATLEHMSQQISALQSAVSALQAGEVGEH